MTTFDYQIKTAEELYQHFVDIDLDIDVPKEEVIFFLKHHSYFQFMLYFRRYRERSAADGKHVFKEDVSWTLIRDTYYFDQRLRLVLLYYISELEGSFKNILCQETCQQYGNIWWTDRQYFQDERIYDEVLVGIIEGIDAGTSRHEQVKKYVRKYDDPKYPPFWNMLEVLSFGQVSKIYKAMDRSMQKIVSSHYGRDPRVLKNWMKTIVETRNKCCHHHYLFHRTNFSPIIVPRKFQGKDIFETHNTDIFGLLCVMYSLLIVLDLDEKFLTELKLLFVEYKHIPDIIRIDWEEKLRLLK